jgi:hypothetical protein
MCRSVGLLDRRPHTDIAPAAQFVPPASAKLTAGDPIKNAQTLLRNALPIENKPIRQIQVWGRRASLGVQCNVRSMAQDRECARVAGA